MKLNKISAAQIIPENIYLYNQDNKPHLYQVEIDPIDFCNHNCNWCFTADFRKDKRLSLPHLKTYLESFISAGGKSVVFSGGGEPLLYKEIYTKTAIFNDKSICRYLIENSIHVGIITNGVLLDNLMDSDFDMRDLSFIRVSLDATNEIEHSILHDTTITGFDVIIKGINRAIVNRADSYTPAIGISFIVDKLNNINYNYSQIANINKLSCELDVDFVQFKHIHTENKNFALENMQSIHSHCIKLDWKNTEFWVQVYDSANTHEICRVSQYIQSIGANSKRYPCCHLFGRTEFLDQNTFHPEGKVVHGCQNKVCRYTEINTLLNGSNLSGMDTLKKSLEQDGFHPFRYCPTSPTILKPYQTIC